MLRKIIIAAALGFGISAHVDFAMAKGAVPLSPDDQAKSAAAAAKMPNLGAQDPATQEALRETQAALTNPAERLKILRADPKADAMDAKIRSQLGSQTEGAYALSSQLMETLVQKTNGDPVKMQEIMTQLMSNPQLLEQYLTPAQREQIHKMAGDMEAKKGHAPAGGSGF